MSKIRLEQGDFNFCFVIRRVSRIKEEREQTVFIQTDWDYPGTASTFRLVGRLRLLHRWHRGLPAQDRLGAYRLGLRLPGREHRQGRG